MPGLLLIPNSHGQYSFCVSLRTVRWWPGAEIPGKKSVEKGCGGGSGDSCLGTSEWPG